MLEYTEIGFLQQKEGEKTKQKRFRLWTEIKNEEEEEGKKNGIHTYMMMMMMMMMTYSALVSAKQMRKVVAAALKRLHSFPRGVVGPWSWLVMVSGNRVLIRFQTSLLLGHWAFSFYYIVHAYHFFGM